MEYCHSSYGSHHIGKMCTKQTITTYIKLIIMQIGFFYALTKDVVDNYGGKKFDCKPKATSFVVLGMCMVCRVFGKIKNEDTVHNLALTICSIAALVRLGLSCVSVFELGGMLYCNTSHIILYTHSVSYTRLGWYSTIKSYGC